MNDLSVLKTEDFIPKKRLFVPNTEGVFYDVPDNIYHAAPGLSHSMTKHLNPPARLPVYLNEKFEPSIEMMIGTLVHQRILEPDKPFPRIAIKPEDMKFSTKEGKAWRTEQQDAGKVIMTQTEFDAVEGCVNSIMGNPVCKELFSEGNSEVSLFHKVDGLLTKARLDFVPWGNIIADIKTCQDGKADRDAWSKVMFDQFYYSQAAWYMDTWNALNPHDEKNHFFFIAVEKAPPYCVNILPVGERSLNEGRKRNAHNRALYQEGLRLNLWKGYDIDIASPVDIPEWAFRQKHKKEYDIWLDLVKSQQS